MKKIVLLSSILLLGVIAFAQTSAPDYIEKEGVRYDRVKTMGELAKIPGIDLSDFKRVVEVPNGGEIAQVVAAGKKGKKTQDSNGDWSCTRGQGGCLCASIRTTPGQGGKIITDVSTGSDAACPDGSTPIVSGLSLYYNRDLDELIVK